MTEPRSIPPASSGVWVDHPDAAYLNLHAARERLCIAQMHVPAHWKDEIQTALNLIDLVGSSFCASQWSKHNQPEYPEARS